MDYMEFNKDLNIVIVDYYSQYPEITKISSTKASSLITQVKSIFARNGIPEIIFSDNGPPFNSKEFIKFCNLWSIKSETSSPQYAQSNGLVERTIQTLKKMLKKCVESKQDPYIALLNFRNSAKGKMPSPAKLLMSRNLRTKMYVDKSMLKPQAVPYETFHNLKTEQVEQMKK
nr:PREDICTED: endogenous retrovirus group K member 18 Pol protein-like [Bemisia tabaci]